MHAYVINLTRSLDRRAHITKELAKANLDYELVSGVDGRELDLQNSSLVDSSFFSRCPFPAGAAGCALSHYRAYKQILDDDRDTALVLEDDIVLPHDVGELIDNLAERLTGAEVALLNFASFPPGPLKVSREESVDLSGARILAFPVDVGQLVNAGAYVITREACIRMVEKAIPIRTTADDWRFFYEEGLLDRVRCVLPAPVVKNARFESTIGLYSLGNGLKAKVLGPLVRRKIPILSQVIRYRRARIQRQWDRAEIVDTPFVARPSRIG